MDLRGAIDRWLGASDWATGVALAVVALYVLIATAMLARSGSGRSERPKSAGHEPRILGWTLSRRRLQFAAKAAAGAAVIWCLGLGLAPDRAAFLSGREWQVQPLYLAVHLITLRLFTHIFALNYLEGTGHLVMPLDAARLSIRRVLGWRGVIAASVVALPFCAIDLRFFLSDRYPKLSGTSLALPVDWLMFAIWCVEWLINALIWVTLISSLVMNVRALRHAQFQAPAHLVLLEKKYRPFLRMSVQSATVVLLFGAATAGYIAYASGEWTDYLGLIVTAVLVAVCFVPPWLVLKRRIGQIVKAEMADLRGMLSHDHANHLTLGADASRPPTLADMERRQREVLALLRMLHLDRLHQDIGRREATAVAVRLLPPALTVGWHIWNTGGMAKTLQVLRGLMG
jgi:hypothetical protein